MVAGDKDPPEKSCVNNCALDEKDIMIPIRTIKKYLFSLVIFKCNIFFIR